MSNSTLITINQHHVVIAAATPIWFHYGSGIILLIATLASIVTNGMVSFVFLIKDRTQLTRANCYILVICLLGITMAIFGIPLVFISCFNKVWYFGEIGCKYYAFLMTFGGLSTMLLLASISIDRYIHVVKSGLSVHMSTKSSFIYITVCLVVTLFFALCPFFGWNEYIYEGVGTACAIDLIGENNNGQTYVITLLVMYFVIPVSVMVFSYGSVYAKVLKESKAHLRSSRNKRDPNAALKNLKMEHQLAVTVTLIIGIFLVCWSPYAFTLLWKLLNPDTVIDPMIIAAPAVIAKTASVFTPLIYLSRNKKFRQNAFEMFPCIRKSSQSVFPAETVMSTLYKETETDMKATSATTLSHGNHVIRQFKTNVNISVLSRDLRPY